MKPTDRFQIPTPKKRNNLNQLFFLSSWNQNYIEEQWNPWIRLAESNGGRCGKHDRTSNSPSLVCQGSTVGDELLKHFGWFEWKNCSFTRWRRRRGKREKKNRDFFLSIFISFFFIILFELVISRKISFIITLVLLL